MSKILIVEDEEKLRNELKIYLENNGYAVNLITDFSDTYNLILNEKSDLILLDINLPHNDGEYLCKNLRKVIDTPIIIVTSRNTLIDEVISINYGADDFITKPYNLQVLLARINRLLSRKNLSTNLIYNNLELDISKSVIIKDLQQYDLSKNECRVFYYLLKNRGKIIERNELMDYLWDNNEFVDDNTLTVNINRLRVKLAMLGYNDIIITKRGQGYIIL